MGKRLRVYISGPITKGDRNENFYLAAQAEVFLMENGFAPLNPMRSMIMPHAWEERFSHNDWLDVDKTWVEVADAVIRLPGASVGADIETEYAKELGLPVFAGQWWLDLRRWRQKNTTPAETKLEPEDPTGTDPNGIDQHAPGAKCDSGKRDLLTSVKTFPNAIAGVSRVAKYGAEKYTPDGWRQVPGGVERFTKALLRHLADGQIEEIDPESGLAHSLHAAWNALAIVELQKQNWPARKV